MRSVAGVLHMELRVWRVRLGDFDHGLGAVDAGDGVAAVG